MKSRNIVKGAKKKFITFLQENDIILRIYLSFALILVFAALLIGVVFLRLYQKNYIKSYTTTLTQQGKTISDNVTTFFKNDKSSQFMKYSGYIDDLEKSEMTDIWIVTNKESSNPLTIDFTSADIENNMTSQMNEVLEKAFSGESASSSSYDKVYGMVILRVAVPVYESKSSKNVSGAVLMVSMLDIKQMGIREGKYLITISVVFSMFIALIVSFGFIKYLSRPLEKIDKDIMKMAQGDYSTNKVNHKNTQLGRLERALAKLAQRLAKNREERKNLDQLRMDFFANVSHELRTPITVMRGYTETLIDGVITEEKDVVDYHARILNECRTMERLVGDLFILSKMQNPDFEIAKEPVSLMQIFNDVEKNAKVLAESKSLKVTMELPEDDPCLMLGDYDRLRQMFMVIIDNAVKFSNENGEINIKVSKNDAKLTISIRDHGVGISDEESKYIFEKFYKSKLKQNEKGTGLGLMIARQIALKHGSDISVKSKLNEGTEFSFTFAECTTIEDFE